jgi:hypothetical protein
MITDAEILALKVEREAQMGPVLTRMREVMNQANGDIVVPLPDLDRNDKPAVANLFKQALDQTSTRIRSVMPMLDCPPLRPNIKRSQDLADDRRRAILGWWEFNGLPRKMGRRARHYTGYGTSPVVIGPDNKRGIPLWHVRNPLTTLAAPSDPDDMCPEDVIFTYPKTMSWLKSNYPDGWARLYTENSKPTDRVDIVEYDDADETVLLASTTGSDAFDAWPPYVTGRSVRLEQFPNLARRPRVIIPGRITLDRMAGQFDGMLPLFQMRARMMALEMIAVEKGIFPDLAIVGFANDPQTPTIVSGEWKDGRSGEVNVIQHGDVRPVALNPGFATTTIIDRLEQAERVETSTPAEFGAESPTNVRTGRRGDAVMQAAIQYPIQEAQEIFQASLEEENRAAVAVAKGWFGNTPKSFYVSWKGGKGQVDYTPNSTFETDNNIVSYPLTGLDAQNLAIAIQTRTGSNLMSLKTGRELDPMIADPRSEEEQLDVENLTAAFRSWLDQTAAQGQLAGDDIVRMIELRQGGNSLIDAYRTAHQEAQTRQAAVTPQGLPSTAPPGTPATQPGMNPPGAGAEVPVSGPPAGLSNIADVLSTLHRAS